MFLVNNAIRKSTSKSEIFQNKKPTGLRDRDTERQRDIETKRHKDRAENKNPEQSWVAQLTSKHL